MKKVLSYIWIPIILLGIFILINVPILFADSYKVELQEVDINADDIVLNDYRDFAFYQDKLYITDGTSIIENTNGDILYTSELGNITSLEATNNKIIFIKENLYLYIYDLETKSITEISVFLNGSEVQAFPTTNRAIAVSAVGDIYMIANNYLAKVENNNLMYVCDLNFNDSVLEFIDGSFGVDEFGNAAVFSIDNQIYEINLKNNRISQISSSVALEIDELSIDNSNNIYALSANILYKINDVTESVALGINTQKMAINFVNGTCYLLDNNAIYLASILNENGSFIAAYSNIPVPIDLYNYAANSSCVTIVSATTNSKLYDYKSLSSSAYQYENIKNLIMLDDSDENFYFVLDSNFSNELGYKTGYILKEQCAILQNEPITSQNLRVVVSQTKLYNLPFSVKLDNNTSAPFSNRVYYGAVLTVVACPLLPQDYSGTNFVAVLYENNIYYIDSRTVVGTEYDTAIDNITVSNASTRAETVVYSDAELTIEVDTLQKGASITILETSNGVCKIEYLVNGELKTGYAKQSFLNDGTLTTTQIIGICLMVLSLILAVVIAIIIAINNKKNKENKTIS